MKGRPVFWQLYFAFLVLSGGALIAFATGSSFLFKNLYLQSVFQGMQSEAQLARLELQRLSENDPTVFFDNASALQVHCQEIGKAARLRLTVVSINGDVICDSQNDPAQMDNHLDRPEIIQTLTGGVGTSQRLSYTVKQEFVYTAVPLRSSQEAGHVAAVVRVGRSIDTVKAYFHKWFSAMVGIFSTLFLLLTVGGWWVARSIERPLELLGGQARRIAKGDFSGRIDPTQFSGYELRKLSMAMNKIALQMNRRIEMIFTQKSEQGAILASLSEGVVAIDSAEKILVINQTARLLFGLSLDENVQGKMIQEALRIAKIQSFCLAALRDGGHSEAEIDVQVGDQIKVLLVKSSPLRDVVGKSVGAVMVVSDFTRVRHLENLRKDFVANVSHELRTPLTAIKGFAETLLNPSVVNGEEMKKFINIIYRQADRLGTIIEDLLMLSRIERDEDSGTVELADTKVLAVITSAIELCAIKAKEREVEIVVECSEGLLAKLNRSLFEQALFNLVDNAIKYSNSGGKVWVRGKAIDQGRVEISVEDNGIGIQKSHFPRLFERFYRVDKARSREIGGTGLGLSIVKHIVALHRGHVEVDSVAGKGSLFKIIL